MAPNGVFYTAGNTWTGGPTAVVNTGRYELTYQLGCLEAYEPADHPIKALGVRTFTNL